MKHTPIIRACRTEVRVNNLCQEVCRQNPVSLAIRVKVVGQQMCRTFAEQGLAIDVVGLAITT